MLPSKIVGVLWDLDDTLIDMVSARERAQRKLLRSLGLAENALPRVIAVWDRMFWHFRADENEAILRAVGEELGEQRLFTDERIASLSRQFYTDIRDNVAPSEGAHAILEACRDHGLPMGLVSNGHHDYQLEKLRATGLADYFTNPDAVVVVDALVGKPHPEPILRCCAALALPPSSVIYVGDRLSDIVAAHLAGCGSVRMLVDSPEYKMPPSTCGLRIETPDAEIHSLRELHALLWGDLAQERTA